jgi:hypothetical protein
MAFRTCACARCRGDVQLVGDLRFGAPSATSWTPRARAVTAFAARAPRTGSAERRPSARGASARRRGRAGNRCHRLQAGAPLNQQRAAAGRHEVGQGPRTGPRAARPSTPRATPGARHAAALARIRERGGNKSRPLVASRVRSCHLERCRSAGNSAWERNRRTGSASFYGTEGHRFESRRARSGRGSTKPNLGISASIGGNGGGNEMPISQPRWRVGMHHAGGWREAFGRRDRRSITRRRHVGSDRSWRARRQPPAPVQ